MTVKQRGFTLVELMIVVSILSVIAMIAMPSYQEYMRRKDVAAAQQYIGCIAMELDRHKAKNFSYKGFAITQTVGTGSDERTEPTTSCVEPRGYTFSLVDINPDTGVDTGNALTAANANGLGWAMKAQASDARLYSLLRNSRGVECKNKAYANIGWNECGTGGESW